MVELRGGTFTQLGPLAIGFAIGLRYLGTPDDGADVALDNGPLWSLDIGVGVELGF